MRTSGSNPREGFRSPDASTQGLWPCPPPGKGLQSSHPWERWPPSNRVTVKFQIAGSEWLPLSYHHWNEDTSPWPKCRNGPSRIEPSEGHCHCLRTSYQMYAGSHGDESVSGSAPFLPVAASAIIQTDMPAAYRRRMMSLILLPMRRWPGSHLGTLWVVAMS